MFKKGQKVVITTSFHNLKEGGTYPVIEDSTGSNVFISDDIGDRREIDPSYFTLINQSNQSNKMEKYYRVVKENFLWEEGAILVLNKTDGSKGGYSPIDDIWDKTDGQAEFISIKVIEAQEDYFERVYPSKLKKALYITKEEMKKAYGNFKK